MVRRGDSGVDDSVGVDGSDELQLRPIQLQFNCGHQSLGNHCENKMIRANYLIHYGNYLTNSPATLM